MSLRLANQSINEKNLILFVQFPFYFLHILTLQEANLTNALWPDYNITLFISLCFCSQSRPGAWGRQLMSTCPQVRGHFFCHKESRRISVTLFVVSRDLVILVTLTTAAHEEWLKRETRRSIAWEQCDQIGRFLKVLGDKLSLKKSPNVWWLFGYLENITF